ncbi:MAG: OB-fold domain-containing protein [Gammaproteobacteria bacterium]|nr:OB-fold domain-containing protein [Gammaproteobacteria bacterium]
MTKIGNLQLLVCDDCGKVQYPDREICADCLGGTLTRKTIDNGGELLSWTRLHASLEPMFQQALPWLIASVRLSSGPVVVAHWVGAEPTMGQAVQVVMVDDPQDRKVLVALDADADEKAAGQLFVADGGSA